MLLRQETDGGGMKEWRIHLGDGQWGNKLIGVSQLWISNRRRCNPLIPAHTGHRVSSSHRGLGIHRHGHKVSRVSDRGQAQRLYGRDKGRECALVKRHERVATCVCMRVQPRRCVADNAFLRACRCEWRNLGGRECLGERVLALTCA